MSVEEKQDLREELAEYAHNAWSRWVEHTLMISRLNLRGSITVPANKVAKWQRQSMTRYEDLTEKEKDSDRKEADKMLDIMRFTKEFRDAKTS